MFWKLGLASIAGLAVALGLSQVVRAAGCGMDMSGCGMAGMSHDKIPMPQSSIVGSFKSDRHSIVTFCVG